MNAIESQLLQTQGSSPGWSSGGVSRCLSCWSSAPISLRRALIHLIFGSRKYPKTHSMPLMKVLLLDRWTTGCDESLRSHLWFLQILWVAILLCLSCKTVRDGESHHNTKMKTNKSPSENKQEPIWKQTSNRRTQRHVSKMGQNKDTDFIKATVLDCTGLTYVHHKWNIHEKYQSLYFLFLAQFLHSLDYVLNQQDKMAICYLGLVVPYDKIQQKLKVKNTKQEKVSPKEWQNQLFSTVFGV